MGLLVAWSCLIASFTGSWGLVYKGVQKADGDVTVREGPRRQQQNRCTEQQTASPCCEKFPLILGVNTHTQRHTDAAESRNRHDFFQTEAESLIIQVF